MWKQAQYLQMKENSVLSLQKYPFTRRSDEEEKRIKELGPDRPYFQFVCAPPKKLFSTSRHWPHVRMTTVMCCQYAVTLVFDLNKYILRQGHNLLYWVVASPVSQIHLWNQLFCSSIIHKHFFAGSNQVKSSQVKSSQDTFIYIALLTIQIVSNDTISK